jgi:hypothetical protein
MYLGFGKQGNENVKSNHTHSTSLIYTDKRSKGNIELLSSWNTCLFSVNFVVFSELFTMNKNSFQSQAEKPK